MGMELFEFFLSLAGIHQLSELIESFHNLGQEVKNILSVVGFFIIIFGALQCFFGYKLFKVWCGFIGLLVGCTIGLILAAADIYGSTEAANVIAIIVIIFLGITGAFAAYRAYLVGLFIYTFVTAFSTCFALMAFITDTVSVGLVVGVIAGLAMGVVAVLFRRFWIILATSVSGGLYVGTGLMLMLQNTETIWAFILSPIVIIAGFFVQDRTVKKTHIKKEYVREKTARESIKKDSNEKKSNEIESNEIEKSVTEKQSGQEANTNDQGS